jgi:hypothetical protein
MVKFLVLLYISVARASMVGQSDWLVDTSQRNCSTHWFFHSESLLVWGW